MALTDAGLELLVSFVTNLIIALLFLAGFEVARFVFPHLYNVRRTIEVGRPGTAPPPPSPVPCAPARRRRVWRLVD
jgi:hypothetical protein